MSSPPAMARIPSSHSTGNLFSACVTLRREEIIFIRSAEVLFAIFSSTSDNIQSHMHNAHRNSGQLFISTQD